MSWPLLAGAPVAMGQESLELLWPDRRGGSKKRKCRSVSQSHREVWQRVEASQEEALVQSKAVQRDEATDHFGEVEYVLNEDEDPWHEFGP